MVTYEYRCLECHKKSERKVPITDHKSKIECPYCKGIATQIIGAGEGTYFLNNWKWW
jgi:putative FmdB family regulatory protein